MRRLLSLMADDATERLRSTSGLQASPPEHVATSCPACGVRMRVQKTVLRHGVTIKHGRFSVRERVLVCSAGCRLPTGVSLTLRPAGLADYLLPRGVYGYDVMVRVGLLRFVHFRQREEIQRTLDEEHGITLSTGQVSMLTKRFLRYVERLHRCRAPELRAALDEDGGWPMHVDATCEDGRGTLLVILAGWRGWALVARKIPTECAESILPQLEDAANLFGMPCAAMRDLGKAVIKALDEFKAKKKLKIPILSCHFHFVADIGRDLLHQLHQALYHGMRSHAVKKQLRSLARDLGKKVGRGISHSQAQEDVLEWQHALDEGHRVPDGLAGLAVTRSLAQWVLDYGADGDGRRFPFEQPHLYLYERCGKGLRALDAFLRVQPRDRKVHRALNKLRDILASVVDDDGIDLTAKKLRYRVRLLQLLRDALRIHKRPPAKSPPQRLPERIDDAEATRTLRDVRSSLGRLIRKLRRERPERGPGEDQREAVDIILDQFQRHRRSLWGHEIRLPEHAGGGIRLVDRTNNGLEGEFNDYKHKERRRSGRKNLTQDLEDLPAEAMLARNLTRPDYVKIVCGSLDALPEAFAGLDRAGEGDSAGVQQVPAASNTIDEEGRLASLPTADRRIVRTQEMQERIRRAAQSRAPRSAMRA